MLEIVVMCLLTHFCLHLWAKLIRVLIRVLEYEESETEEELDNRSKASRGWRDIWIRVNLEPDTEYETKEENENPVSNLSGNKEQYSPQREVKWNIDVQDPREQIISLTYEIDKTNEAANACHRNLIWANQEGMKGKEDLFIAYVAIKRKMTRLEKQLAALKRNVEGENCTDESCIMRKDTFFQGRDIRKISETSCKRWHTQRKTGLETGTRPRDSRLRLCQEDYGCTDNSCTAWHQRDAKFCLAPWATCLTWHGGNCKAKMPVEEQQTSLDKEEKEKFICMHDIGTCLDHECTKFHYTGMWINTSPKGWIEKATGRSQVPLLTMIPLCTNGRSTTKTTCLKQDCPDRHQYPRVVSVELHGMPKKYKTEGKQPEGFRILRETEGFRILTRILREGAAESTKSSGTSSYANYKFEAKEAKRDEEIQLEAKRIERPTGVARLEAESAIDNTKKVEDNSTVDQKKKGQLHVTTLSVEDCNEKRKGARNCAKAEDWEESKKTFLEEGTTYLNKVCQKMAMDQRTKDTRMEPTVRYSSPLLTDVNESGDSSGYRTQRQQEKDKRAQKLDRKTLRAQKVKEAEEIGAEYAKQGDNENKINAEKDEVVSTQKNHDHFHTRPEEEKEGNEGYQSSKVEKRGPTLVLDDYKGILGMGKFTEEPDFWQSVLDTFGIDPKTGLRIIPPIVKHTIFEVEHPKGRIIEAFKENIKGSEDQHHIIFETARMMVKLGIHPLLLPTIYTDHLMPPEERKALKLNPEVRNSLTALLDYARNKNHPVRKMGKAAARAIRYYTRELEMEDACLVKATRILKEIYARNIAMNQSNYSQLSSGERDLLQESLAKGIMENELKRNYKETWEKALEKGLWAYNYPVKKLAEKMKKIFELAKKKGHNTVATGQEAKEMVKKPSENKDTETSKKGEIEQEDRNGHPLSGEELLKTTSNEENHHDHPPKVTYIEGNPWECLYHITDEGRRLPIMYDKREETDYDRSREQTSTGGNLEEFLWSSANGTVENVKLPCRYHEDKGVTAMECMSGPEHCYECSEPGHLAPPIRQCKGRHKWKPMNKRERRRR